MIKLSSVELSITYMFSSFINRLWLLLLYDFDWMQSYDSLPKLDLQTI